MESEIMKQIAYQKEHNSFELLIEKSLPIDLLKKLMKDYIVFEFITDGDINHTCLYTQCFCEDRIKIRNTLIRW